MKNIIVCIFIGACLSVNPVFAKEAGTDGYTVEKATDIKTKESTKQKKPAKKKSPKVDKVDGEAVDVDHGTWSDIKTDDSSPVRDKGGKK